MRTTLDLDDDVLAALKERARAERTSAGRVASRLIRAAMTGSGANSGTALAESAARYGIVPFAPRGALVTNELIDGLRDDEGL